MRQKLKEKKCGISLTVFARNLLEGDIQSSVIMDSYAQA